jgi:glycosyltransferase involved in cell wall biosynthesis
MSRPTVSVVMPVGYGDRYFRVALTCFLTQTYNGPLEIIVLDNSVEPIEHLIPADQRIKYHRCERLTIGALRNLGASYATGDIIVNGDEDDYSHPDRVEAQVERIVTLGKAVTGYHNILFFNTYDGGTYKYHFSRGRIHPPYACGTSQVYLRTWWEKHPYQDITKGEDYWFQKDALDAGQLDSVDAEHHCIMRAHKDSTCPPMFGCSQFPAVPRTDFPKAFWTAISA